jgi:predicted site-specific integrase-resolvase
MNLNEKFDLIKRNTEEILTEKENDGNWINLRKSSQLIHKFLEHNNIAKQKAGSLVFPEKMNTLETYIYCRVSSNNKKDDLERQSLRCLEFCNSKGFEVFKIIKEVASGMNDNRKKLISMLDENPTKIIIEHKDRLTRFGFNSLEKLLSKLNCEIIVINRDAENETDLLKDLVSIITYFCCRLYGLRRGNNKSKKIKDIIKIEND